MTPVRVLALPAALGLLAAVSTAAWHPVSAPAAPAGTLAHRVVAGDSLWTLAQASHTTVATLKSLNHLSADTAILGTVLYLPAGTTTGTGTGTGTAATGPAPTVSSHVVVVGDTLSGLAAQAHTTIATLRSLNASIPVNGTVVLGEVLKLPGTAVPAPAAASPAYASGIAASRQTLAAQAYTTRAAAESLVRSEALRQGVEPALALAIADQESGFQQGVVSRTNAVGVMQLEPDTAAWIGTALLGRTLNRYDITDNVVGGVALLHALLSVAPVRTAVAAYYQGLASVQKRGMYADTAAYVRNVLALRLRYS